MINYWWVTRPKRKLNSVPEILACCAGVSLDNEWQGNIYTHLAFEEALEQSGLKRIGERRDQRGSGGRTYFAWLFSLGLVFKHEASNQIKLTMAGEAIMNGASPVAVLRNQILKYQFPSPFSISSNAKSRVHERFKIRPFRFLLKLLRDERLDYYTTQEEIEKIIITEAQSEDDRHYEYIVERILLFRSYGDNALEPNFLEKYAPSSGKVNPKDPMGHLRDVANTIVNWLEYTQFITRNADNCSGKIRILSECEDEIDSILRNETPLIDRPYEQEYFQRKYGLDPFHQRDNRNFALTPNVTPEIINEHKIRQAFISVSQKTPIFNITSDLIEVISDQTGIHRNLVEDTIARIYPHGAIGEFMTEYFEMAFSGKDNAKDFERATVELFREAFHFDTYHVGPIGKTPDVLMVSDENGYQAIIDNKAYSKYSITNDHHNRMVYNYIGELARYSESEYPLAFFSYIAGGFGGNISNQIQAISGATGVPGSAISVSNIIKMVEKNQLDPYSHTKIRDIFSLNRQIFINDI